MDGNEFNIRMTALKKAYMEKCIVEKLIEIVKDKEAGKPYDRDMYLSLKEMADGNYL